MNRIRKEMQRFHVLGGMAAIVIGAVLLAFPMMAGAVGKFPAIAVKLNGVTANTNPSSGRCCT